MSQQDNQAEQKFLEHFRDDIVDCLLNLRYSLNNLSGNMVTAELIENLRKTRQILGGSGRLIHPDLTSWLGNLAVVTNNLEQPNATLSAVRKELIYEILDSIEATLETLSGKAEVTPQKQVRSRMLINAQAEAISNVSVFYRKLLDTTQDASSPGFIKEIFRAAHTIANNSRMLNFTEISILAQHIEVVVGNVRDGSLTFSEAVRNLLLEAADVLLYVIEATYHREKHTFDVGAVWQKLATFNQADQQFNLEKKLQRRGLDTFKKEVDKNLQIFETRLAQLTKNPTPEQYIENIKQAYRAIHTIKSNSRMLDFIEISNLALQLEAILGKMRDDGFQLDDKSDLLLFAAAQAIDQMVEAAVENEPLPEVALPSLLERLQEISGLSLKPIQSTKQPETPAENLPKPPTFSLGRDLYPEILWALQGVIRRRSDQLLEFSCSGGEIRVSAEVLEKLRFSLLCAILRFTNAGKQNYQYCLKAFKTDNADKFYLHLIGNNRIEFKYIRESIARRNPALAEHVANLSDQELFEVMDKQPPYYSTQEALGFVHPFEIFRQQGFGFRFKEQDEQFITFELEIPFE